MQNELTGDSNLLNNGVVDTDLKSGTNLLNKTETLDGVRKEVLTEVTSIAQEEARTGQKINMPSQEELLARTSANLLVNQRRMNMVISRLNGGTKYAISRKGMNRVMNAIFSLPAEGLPVRLQSEEEKAAFAIGQNLIRDMFVIMANHAFEEAKKAKRNELTKEQGSANVEQPTNPEGVTNE
jgi:hypothetical protein